MEANQEKKEKQVQVVVFTLDKEEYASSVEDIQEVITIPEITPVPRSPAFIAGVINLRGKVIPVVDLEKRFGLVREDKEQKTKNIIVVDEKETPFGVIVDEVTQVLRVQASNIQEAPASVSSKIGGSYIKGIVVITEHADEVETPDHLANNRVLLLLDIKKILSAEDKQVVNENVAKDITRPEMHV